MSTANSTAPLICPITISTTVTLLEAEARGPATATAAGNEYTWFGYYFSTTRDFVFAVVKNSNGHVIEVCASPAYVPVGTSLMPSAPVTAAARLSALQTLLGVTSSTWYMLSGSSIIFRPSTSSPLAFNTTGLYSATAGMYTTYPTKPILSSQMPGTWNNAMDCTYTAISPSGGG